MKILITGGAGFIGSHLSEFLLNKGREVVVIDDLSTGSLENIRHLIPRAGFKFVFDSVANEMVMDRLVSECDLLVHLAAAVGVTLIVDDPVGVIATNVFGTEIVLKTANRYRKKIIIASTSEVYGKSSESMFNEEGDIILGPTTKHRWVYACSKALDEFAALAYHREFGLPAIIVRFFNTVGVRQTGQYGMVVPRLVGQALAGQPLRVHGDGEQSRCFCNVRDTVTALDLLMNNDAAVGEIFNIGTQEEITINDLARRIVEVTGSASEIVHVPYEEAYEKGFEDMRRRMPDISKLKRVTGFQPSIPLEETLREIADSMGEGGKRR